MTPRPALALLALLWPATAHAASAPYPAWLEAILSGVPPAGLTGATVQCALIDETQHTYSASDQHASDIPSGARVGAPQTLTNMTFTGGRLLADPLVFSQLVGPVVTAIDCWRVGLNEVTSPLIVYINGFTLTPNGSTITINWNQVYGLFTL